MPKSERDGSKPWVDPDDAPELDADHFERADVYRGETLLRRGRGKQKAPTKTRISIRIDPQTLAAYQAGGRGWQTRMSEALKAAAGELAAGADGNGKSVGTAKGKASAKRAIKPA